MGLAIGAEMAAGAVEHRGRVVEVFAGALAVGKDERHPLLAREVQERCCNRAWQLEKVFRGVLDEAVGEEGCQEQLGEADDVRALACRLLDHAAGRLDAGPHVVREHGTRLGRRHRDRPCHAVLLAPSGLAP